jgi:hypothetical protein
MKRHLLKLGVFLLLGVVVNVAVAWGIAIAPSAAFRGFEREWVNSHPQTFVWTNASELCISQSSGLTTFYWADEGPQRVDEETYQRLIPIGSVFSGHDPVRDSVIPNVIIDISEQLIGWPFLAMASRTISRHEPEVSFSLETTALKLPSEWSLGSGRNKTRSMLPVVPIWPGFAINTIFYAAMLWMLLFVPGKIRRFIRIRGHRCPACGYQIVPGGGIGPVCSECGAELPASWSTKSP